jgi:hypothetical protein
MSYIKKIYFPLRLKSSLCNIRIGKTVFIKRIDDISCQRALGIRNIVYDFDVDGNIKKISRGEGSSMGFELHMPPLEEHTRVSPRLLNTVLLNFVLVVNTLEEANNFQHALKLTNYRTRSGISVGFSYAPGGYSLSFIHPEPYFGKEIFELNRSNVKSLAEIMTQLLMMQSDTKLQLILQKYQYALSSEGLSNPQRFLEFAIILEMLLLPEQNAELRYRFSLRFAKLFTKYDGQNENINDLYEHGKTLYDIRSKIVHKGADDRIKMTMDMITKFTKRAILLYLRDRSIFSEKTLDILCLT